MEGVVALVSGTSSNEWSVFVFVSLFIVRCRGLTLSIHTCVGRTVDACRYSRYVDR